MDRHLTVNVDFFLQDQGQSLGENYSIGRSSNSVTCCLYSMNSGDVNEFKFIFTSTVGEFGLCPLHKMHS